jgi:hypothetical protein
MMRPFARTFLQFCRPYNVTNDPQYDQSFNVIPGESWDRNPKQVEVFCSGGTLLLLLSAYIAGQPFAAFC